MYHSDSEAVTPALVLQKMVSRQITDVSSLPGMLPPSTHAADLASLAQVLVVCTNRAWKNETLLGQLVKCSSHQSSDFAPRAAITAIRTLFSEIALEPQARDSKGSVLSARALRVAERLGAAHVPSLSQELREDTSRLQPRPILSVWRVATRGSFVICPLRG